MSGAVTVADTEETDPNFNQTVLLLHGDGTNGGQNNTFVDSSSHTQSITRHGTVTQGTFNPFLGEGQYSRYVQANTDTDSHGSGITLGTNNFTIGMFVYPIGCDNVVGQALTSGGNSRTALYADTGGTSVILAHNQLLVAAPSTWDVEINFTTAIALNQWQWIQVDRTGNLFRVSIDGSYVDGGGATVSGSVPAISTGTFGQRLGQDNYLGYYNNFILINGANRGSITPPSTPSTADSNTALLLHQSNRLVNNGNTSVTLTSGNDNKILPYSPLAPTASYSESVHGGSGYFDGAGNKLQIDGQSSTDFYLDDDAEWCVEFWVYMINPESNFARVMQINSNGWAIRFDATSAKIGIGQSDDGSTDDLEDPTALPSHQWTHFAFTNKNQSGTYHLRLFRNGVQVATTSGWSKNWTNKDSTTSDGNLNIAAYYNDNFPGIMYLGTTRLVQGDYIYDSTFTPPTAPLTSTGTGTKLLLNFTNASIIDNTMKNNGETIADAQLDTSVKKFGTASMEFDGTGDYVRFLNNPFFTFGTGDFTIECFVYFNNTGGTQYICGQSHGDPASDTALQIYIYNGNLYGWVGTSGNEVSASVFSHQTWVHLAFVRQGENIRLYFDGVQQDSTNIGATYSPTVSTGPFSLGTVGNYNQGNLNAFLDEFRVTKGLCRYPDGTTFTPPTKAFANR